ncbi:hypothetical protein D3C80_876610 [compost metagenome]
MLGSAVGRRLDLVIPLLAHGAGVGVDGQDVLDQRIGRGLDGGQPAFPQGAAHGRVSQLGASDQTRRQGLGAFLAQQGADIGAVDGQPFAGLGQPPFQSDLLQRRIGRTLGEQAGLDARQTAVGEFTKPLIRRLGAFLSAAHDGPRPLEQGRAARHRGRAHARAAFQQGHRGVEFACDRLDLGQGGPGIADLTRQGLVLGHAATEDGFLPGQLIHEGRVNQGRHATATAFVGVLDANDGVHGDEGLFLAFLGIADQTAAQLRGDQLVHRQDYVADGHQLGLGQQALGRAGVAGDEDRLALGRLVGVPGEVGRGRGGLAVFVEADEGRIDGEAREGEVVQVAAEGRGAVFRRPGQAHVGVFAELVELELAAAIQADHLTADLGVVAAGFGFDAAGLGLARLGEGLAVQALARLLHPRGDVGDVGQDLGRTAGAFQLLLAAPGREAGLGVLQLRRGQVGDAGGDAVVVGHHQAFAGNDARRAAAELDRGQADAVQPVLVDRGAQRLVGAGDGEVVVGPHALLRLGGRGGGEGQDGGRGEE